MHLRETMTWLSREGDFNMIDQCIHGERQSLTCSIIEHSLRILTVFQRKVVNCGTVSILRSNYGLEVVNISNSMVLTYP